MDYQDILYEEKDHVARITINRPDKYNAFRNSTAPAGTRTSASSC